MHVCVELCTHTGDDLASLMSVDKRTMNACEMRNVNGALIGRDRFNKMCSSLAAEVNTICLDPINDCHAARSVGPRHPGLYPGWSWWDHGRLYQLINVCRLRWFLSHAVRSRR